MQVKTLIFGRALPATRLAPVLLPATIAAVASGLMFAFPATAQGPAAA